jgi:hypothetical protein
VDQIDFAVTLPKTIRQGFMSTTLTSAIAPESPREAIAYALDQYDWDGDQHSTFRSVINI